jgi:hypothetical protein
MELLTIDRGYLDFNFLRDLDSTGMFFVTRAKGNTDFDIVKALNLPEKSETLSVMITSCLLDSKLRTSIKNAYVWYRLPILKQGK